jgi:hypothetical protein
VFSPGGELIAAFAGFIPVTSSIRSQKQLVSLCRSAAVELTTGIVS